MDAETTVWVSYSKVIEIWNTTQLTQFINFFDGNVIG